MGYETAKGRYASTIPVDMGIGVVGDGVAATAITKVATANGPSIELGDRGTLRLKLQVTAASGDTPTLDVAVQTSSDAGVSDAWRAVGTAFAQKTGAATEYKTLAGLDRFVRYVATIGAVATPSFTFKLAGEAV